jgi:hypothetical protein
MNLFRLKDGNYTGQRSVNGSALLLVALLLACFAISRQIGRYWLLLTGILAASCTPNGPPPIVGQETVWEIGTGRAEIASAVIPPGANAECPNGRIFIVAAAGGKSPAVYAADFHSSGTLQAVSPQPSSNFSLTPTTACWRVTSY